MLTSRPLDRRQAHRFARSLTLAMSIALLGAGPVSAKKTPPGSHSSPEESAVPILPALAHEIEHALQDQYFDLKSFSTPLKDEGDRQLARAALVEGDGTAVMLEFVAQGLGIDLPRVPDLIDQPGQQLAAGAMNQSPV